MVKDKLYLDDHLIDLDGSETPAITLQVNNLFELKDRQAIRSNKFKVVKSQNNRAALQACDMIQSETDLPYTKVSARFIKNGIEVVPNGFAIVESAGEFFEVTIYSGVANFFELIKGLYLSDLNLDDLNFLFRIGEVETFSTATAGIFYPIAAFTDDTAYINNTTNIIDIRRSMPFIYAHTLVTRIIESAGFVVDPNSYFNAGKLFQNFIIQLCNEKFTVTGKLLRANLTTIVPNLDYLTIDDSSSGSAVLRTGAFDIGTAWLDSTGGTGGNKRYYEFQQDVQVPTNFNLNFHLEIKLTGGTPYYESYIIYLEYTETLLPIFSIELGPFSVAPGATAFYSLDVPLPPGNYKTGPGCRVGIRHRITSYNTPQGTFTYLPGTYVEASSDAGIYINHGDPVIISENIPKITQLDFIKAFAQIAALTLDVDSDSSQVHAVPFKTIAENKAVADDWSEKLDVKFQEPDFDYRFGNYAQKNWMRYKKDENVTSELGDYYFLINDKNLQNEIEMFTLIFAATESLNFLIDLSIPYINRWDSATGNPTVKTQPRILLVDNDLVLYPGTTVDLTDGTTTVTLGSPRYSFFINAFMPDNLDFASLIRIFYSDLATALDRAKLLRAYFRLTEKDIENFDSTIPKYIQKYNNYFYLNKIINWQNSECTKCEMIKI